MSALEDLYNSLYKKPCPAKQEAGSKMYIETLSKPTFTASQVADKPTPVKVETPEKTIPDNSFSRDFAVSSHNKLNHKDAIFRIFAPQPDGQNVGSGFFCTPQGEFLTDLHVVGNAHALRIILNDGQQLTGIVDQRDKANDLASGHVVNPQKSLSYLKFEKSQPLEPSKSGTYAAGYAYGREFQFMPGKFRNMSYVGVVSDGDLESGEDPRRPVIITDNFTAPAMSGGVLFNAEYMPIGIIDKGDIANKGINSKTISTPIETGLRLLKR